MDIVEFERFNWGWCSARNREVVVSISRLLLLPTVVTEAVGESFSLDFDSVKAVVSSFLTAALDGVTFGVPEVVTAAAATAAAVFEEDGVSFLSISSFLGIRDVGLGEAISPS